MYSGTFLECVKIHCIKTAQSWFDGERSALDEVWRAEEVLFGKCMATSDVN